MIGPIILQVILIFLNATFASAEIAVISMKDARLKKLADDGDKRAKRLSSLTAQPAKFLATIQVAITLAGLLGSAFAAESFADPLARSLSEAGVGVPENVLKSVSVVVITLILAYFNLVFGELVPKRIAMKKAETLALGMSGLLHGVSRIFAPLVFLLTASTNGILRLMGIDPDGDDEEISEEEIRTLVLAGRKQGVIDQEETEMIQNVFEFDDISAEQICTHRVNVISLSTEDSLKAWEETIYGSGHTYYPVCGASTDDVVGVLNTKKYFRGPKESLKQIMDTAMEPGFYVPESMRANNLFRKMKQMGNYFAVVIDEYGGLSGIVTLYDLMEEIVGDLPFDEEKGRSDILSLGAQQWQIAGSADLDDVAEALGVELPLDDYDTFGGFLCGLLGRIPEEGETLKTEFDRFAVTIHQVENHRIGITTVEKS